MFAFVAVVGLATFSGMSFAWADQPVTRRVRHRTRARKRVARSRHPSKHRVRRRRYHRRARRRTYQVHPTAERYKEIQQALANKGYYRGEIDGKWGPGSISALQRFQTDQGIENEGKITALALIGLGLGPKHVNALQPGASSEERITGNDSEISERERTPASPGDHDATPNPPRMN
ncbi:MAG TPA: peptidoglycan-binding domain-containing protein [Bryobacteraceae bacterium]|jgi:hypothetical protein